LPVSNVLAAKELIAQLSVSAAAFAVCLSVK